MSVFEKFFTKKSDKGMKAPEEKKSAGITMLTKWQM